MPEPPNLGAAPGAAQAKERRLESWGEIAAYLRREIRTVQRWEKNLGLPIHRLAVGKQSSVYAYPSELDKWYIEREPSDVDAKEDDFTEEPALEAKDPGAPVANSNTKPPSTIASQSQITTPFSKRKSTWLTAIAVLIASGIFVARAIFPITPNPTPVAPSGEKIRLFVRPLSTIGSQSEFADGLTSELITRLGGLDPKHLGVIAPTSSKQLGAKPISELEPLLKLNYVLEGSVRHENENVRIDLSLISAKDQTLLWSDRYNEKLSDILKVQDEVAEAVAQKLLLNLPPVSSAASVDPEGYSSYLRGRRAWTNRDLERSVSAFEEAV
ncbi:MAG TPA: hypothetical protein VM781_02350, partial [Candidatus Bathyarchaeia archaeon]|nr:hypothetical protein [Candidatus Bathyarchaeia archaeon]